MSETTENKKSRKSTPRVERIPPNAIDVEMAVLGSMMLDQEAAARVVDVQKAVVAAVDP